MRANACISCLLTLDLDNFRFIQVDFVADGGFLLIIHIGFRKFWWISIFRPTGYGPGAVRCRPVWLIVTTVKPLNVYGHYRSKDHEVKLPTPIHGT